MLWGCGMTHHCHAKGCTAGCKPEFLMCPRHWRRVPRRTQIAVYRYYRSGQCQDMNPSPEWHAAADVAIAQVAFKERRISQETLSRIVAKAKTALSIEDGVTHDHR